MVNMLYQLSVHCHRTMVLLEVLDSKQQVAEEGKLQYFDNISSTNNK